MRLLILTYEFPPLGGGAGNAAAELVRALEDEPNLEVVVVTSSVGDYNVERFTRNSTIYYLPIGKKGNIHFQTNQELLRYTYACHRMILACGRTRSSPYRCPSFLSAMTRRASSPPQRVRQFLADPVDLSRRHPAEKRQGDLAVGRVLSVG